jgi:hypothetical protein
MTHRLAFVVIADPAFEGGVPAAGRIKDARTFGCGVDG